MIFTMYFSNQHAIKNEWVKWQKFGSIISGVIAILMKFNKYIYRGWMRNNNNCLYVRRLYHLGQKEVLTFALYFINYWWY